MSDEIKKVETPEKIIESAISTDDEDVTVGKDTNIWSLMVLKFLSGRFILTVSGAVCFALITRTICKVIALKADAISVTEITSVLSSILIVVSNVFTFYFVRKAMNNEGTTGK